MRPPASEVAETAGAGRDHRTGGGEWLRAAALAAVWLPFFWKLSPAWSASVEQAHGWAVPLLAAYFWRERACEGGNGIILKNAVETRSPRTTQRTKPNHDSRRIFSSGVNLSGMPISRRFVRGLRALRVSIGEFKIIRNTYERGSSGRMQAGGAGMCVMGGAAGLALGLTVLEANPLWPAAEWGAYAAAALVTFAMQMGEGGWRQARRFWFPIFFVSTALAWPTAATVRLQAALVGMNTQLAASVVSALGFPAVVSGNAIEVARGFVGVDEACSGVRSWQATWMAGWFFGELLGLGAARRLALVAGSLAAAVAGNLIRTTMLTWLAAAHGPAASARWHDAAGTAEMIFVLAGVAGLAWRLGKRRPAVEAERNTKEAGARLNGVQRCATKLHVGAIAAGILAASAPTVWYRWHEAHRGGRPVQWELRAPEAGWRAVELPKATRDLLRATASGGFERSDAATGARTTVLLVRWDGDVANAVFAEQHGPAVCLPAAGTNLAMAARPAVIVLDGVRVDFQVGHFKADGRVQQVLFCQWDAWLGRARGPTHEALDDVAGWRWARVREGRRRGDAAYIVFILPEENEAAARTWLTDWAPRWLRRR